MVGAVADEGLFSFRVLFRLAVGRTIVLGKQGGEQEAGTTWRVNLATGGLGGGVPVRHRLGGSQPALPVSPSTATAGTVLCPDGTAKGPDVAFAFFFFFYAHLMGKSRLILLFHYVNYSSKRILLCPR